MKNILRLVLRNKEGVHGTRDLHEIFKKAERSYTRNYLGEKKRHRFTDNCKNRFVASAQDALLRPFFLAVEMEGSVLRMCICSLEVCPR
jgi:hypothetical protein